MSEKLPGEGDKGRLSLQSIWRLALLILGLIAVAQELRKPPEERTWNGKVAGFVPYEFRLPTIDRLRDTYWNPDGAILTSKLWGVGWAINLGALKSRFGG
jgi:hypothetical protein